NASYLFTNKGKTSAEKTYEAQVVKEQNAAENSSPSTRTMGAKNEGISHLWTHGMGTKNLTRRHRPKAEKED
ncbi:hypothetical protein, partial [Escherichia coli]|uniref:hypothetical protein n=1 Tax=Escherichia coli TaxID=562 RepID=UPI00142E9119